MSALLAGGTLRHLVGDAAWTALDAVAAAVIIERWLDAPGDATPVSLAPHVST